MRQFLFRKKIKINSCYIIKYVYICSYNNNNNMNKLKQLTHQLNAEIRANFERGNYEIVRKNSFFYMIKIEGIEAEIYTQVHASHVDLGLPCGGILKFPMAAFDLYLDKIKAYQNKTKAARIAELEKELKEVQNG